MNTNMYENPILQDNLDICRRYGMEVITPAWGYLACGDTGAGKMPEPEVLYEYILREAGYPGDLAGRRILVTAGPTRESIDPVRYITNHSTGKMGYAIARVAAYRGADVTLVSGPVDLDRPLFVETVPVESAREMFEAVTARSGEQDIIVKAAAVADYRPSTVGTEKSRNPTVIYPSPWSGLTTSWGGWGRTGGTDSSSADFPWRPRICWRIPGPSWQKAD